MYIETIILTVYGWCDRGRQKGFVYRLCGAEVRLEVQVAQSLKQFARLLYCGLYVAA